MPRLSTVGVAALAATIALAPAHAQDPGSRQTREFLRQAAGSDTFELMSAYSALAGSSDPQTRSFAQRMIQDHTATSNALRDAAVRAGLKPPVMAMTSDQSELLATLQSQRGPDLDRVYAEQQALAHHAALVVEQRYAQTGDQPAIRQVARSAVPVISGHLAMAEQMKGKFGGS